MTAMRECRKTYAFHQTVRGTSHKNRGLPCEDASGSFATTEGEKKNYCIAVVADGHGASQCFRSGTGAEIAVAAAIDCMKQTAEVILDGHEGTTWFINDILKSPRERTVFLRHLSNSIVSGWYWKVQTHFAEHPLSAAELQEHPGPYDGDLSRARIYGSTLIAALWTSIGLILLQQGDGRCDVFYEDGTLDQPVPWDEKCQENVTTSLCDADAAQRIRSILVPFSAGRRPIACFLGSDGVEDAYRDTYEAVEGGELHGLMGGVHTFYKDMICDISDQYGNGNYDAFERGLADRLSVFSGHGKFSRAGSGDDVSVAGIVDSYGISLNSALKARFRVDVERYRLEEELFWIQDSLRSKSRKLETLRRRFQEADLKYRRASSSVMSADTAVTREYNEIRKEYENYRSQYDTVSQNRERVEKELARLRELSSGGRLSP